ncbi:hypothetical protein BACCAP_02465 [Pseudoflavonifractor capillosus ATCC 29799]|uniref:Uncharacterized protein n=1 Tax=Pseudoflavonifractor capillosus ATCC 29799 TaxID=411467 RepID=A6NW72_9FIRM|nr:hypothetical protein BACCAP_02465 [Pseudoflavonifractor capillosus ATCC 29799]
MDGRDFIKALPFVAAVVDTLRPSGCFQCPVGIVRPRRPPDFSFSFVIPVGGVLSVILPAPFTIWDTLAALVQVIDLAALCAPLTIFFQRADRQQNMGMGISVPFVIISPPSGGLEKCSFSEKIQFCVHLLFHVGKPMDT